MKTIKKILVLSPLLLVLPLVSCSRSQGDSVSDGTSDVYENQKYSEKVSFNYWSTYGVSKVLRNFKSDEASRYYNLGQSISIDMMKNEVEGSQLIISTKGSKYTYVDVELSDLTSAEGKTLSKDNISVYYQRYMVLPNAGTMNPRYELNDYVPDMLLPLDIAKQYRENKVYGSANQGLTFEVNSKGVESGVYEGNITIKVGKTTKVVPISVNVWDIEYVGRRNFKTSFLLYRNHLINYEYDNSEELCNNYVDFLNRYKVNTYVIQTAGDNSTTYFRNSILRQIEDDNYSSIVIPVDFPTNYVQNAKDSYYKRCIEYIKVLVELSIQLNENIVDLAYFYPSSYDEADLDTSRKAASERLFGKNGELDKTLQDAVTQLNNENIFANISDEFKEQLTNSILNIPKVFTNVNLIDEWVGELGATFCPYMSLFNDNATSEKYISAAKYNSNYDLWAYSCMAPNYPYATFHIDDDNIAMRANGWMNKKIGINGYLYYAVNLANHSTDNSELVDPYNDPLRYEGVAGDGYLLYPGRKYASEYPFASNRLANYRDSMDDYDMLCVLENKINELAEFYGFTDISLADYIDDIYFEMFSGATNKASEEKFYELRKELANRILDLNNDESQLFVVNKYDDTSAVTRIYANASQIKVDNVSYEGSASGSGYLFNIPTAKEAKTLKIEVKGKTYEKEVKGLTFATNFGSGLDGINKNDNSVISTSDNSLTATIKSQYAKKEGVIDNATIKFAPYVSFNIENLEDYDGLYFDYEVLSDEDVEFNLGVNNGKYNILLQTNFCASKDKSSSHIDLSNVDRQYLESAKEIRLYFTNVKYDSSGKASLFEDRTLKISNLVLERGK